MRYVRYYAPAVAVFIGGILLWELAVRALQIQRFLLPPPSDIAAALNARGIRSARGGKWHVSAVQNLFARTHQRVGFVTGE